MIKINLLPFRAARKKENIRQQASIFLLSFVFIAIGVFYYHISLNNKIDELNTNLKDTEKQLQKFRKINIEIAVIKRELKELNKKLEVIHTLDMNREGPVRLLDAMTDIVVPKRMWFTNLEEKKIKATEETTKNIITIKGTALDNKTVADFMTRLEASKFFTNVELLTLKQEKETGDQNLKIFQVRCEIAQEKNDTKKGHKK